jgi:hypothetical protein
MEHRVLFTIDTAYASDNYGDHLVFGGEVLWLLFFFVIVGRVCIGIEIPVLCRLCLELIPVPKGKFSEVKLFFRQGELCNCNTDEDKGSVR